LDLIENKEEKLTIQSYALDDGAACEPFIYIRFDVRFFHRAAGIHYEMFNYDCILNLLGLHLDTLYISTHVVFTIGRSSEAQTYYASMVDIVLNA
jgi:hypothetical protein